MITKLKTWFRLLLVKFLRGGRTLVSYSVPSGRKWKIAVDTQKQSSSYFLTLIPLENVTIPKFSVSAVKTGLIVKLDNMEDPSIPVLFYCTNMMGANLDFCLIDPTLLITQDEREIVLQFANWTEQDIVLNANNFKGVNYTSVLEAIKVRKGAIR